MYLTRFEINRRRRGATRLLASPQAMHAAVAAAVPGGAGAAAAHDPMEVLDPPSRPAGTGRLLWRVDDDGERAVLYLVSPERPDLTHLVEQAGWPTLDDPWRTRPYTPLLDRLARGQRWAFRLAANPTHAVRVQPDAPTQRLGHVTVAQQQGWLLQRAEARGFRLVPATVDPASVPEGDPAPVALAVRRRGVATFARNDPRLERRERVTLNVAVFDGVLEVTDADLLRGALTQGIGPAKAYGCGLMTLASAAGR